MTSWFSPIGDGVLLTLGDGERFLLRQVFTGLRGMLESYDDVEDPVVRRLYPPASMEDELHAAVFDIINRGELREGRRVALESVERTTEIGGPLSGAEAQAWLTTLTDARIVLGVRLSVTEETTMDDFAHLGPDDDDRAAYVVYAMLGQMQEQLIEALMDGEE